MFSINAFELHSMDNLYILKYDIDCTDGKGKTHLSSCH